MKTPPPATTTTAEAIPLPKDARHQRYADGILQGLEGWDAYMKAFPDCRTKASAHTGHKRASKRADVKAYMQAVQLEARDSSVLTVLEKRRFLARVVRTPINEGMDPRELEQKNLDLVKSYSTSETETGTTFRLERLDPLKAIEIDNKLSGDDTGITALKDLADALHSIAGGPIPTDKL